MWKQETVRFEIFFFQLMHCHSPAVMECKLELILILPSCHGHKESLMRQGDCLIIMYFLPASDR